jgi:hypothetical protein
MSVLEVGANADIRLDGRTVARMKEDREGRLAAVRDADGKMHR